MEIDKTDANIILRVMSYYAEEIDYFDELSKSDQIRYPEIMWELMRLLGIENLEDLDNDW